MVRIQPIAFVGGLLFTVAGLVLTQVDDMTWLWFPLIYFGGFMVGRGVKIQRRKLVDP